MAWPFYVSSGNIRRLVFHSLNFQVSSDISDEKVRHKKHARASKNLLSDIFASDPAFVVGRKTS